MNKYEDLKLTRVKGEDCFIDNNIEVITKKTSKYNNSDNFKLVECGFNYFDLNDEGYNNAKNFIDNLTICNFTDITFENGEWLEDKYGTFINKNYYDKGQYKYVWENKNTCMLIRKVNNKKHILCIYLYDNSGKLLYIRRNNMAGVLSQSIENQYDKHGRITNSIVLTRKTLDCIMQVKTKYNDSNYTSVEYHYKNDRLKYKIIAQWDETFTHKLYQYKLNCSEAIVHDNYNTHIDYIESISKFEYGEDGTEYVFERRNPRKKTLSNINKKII